MSFVIQVIVDGLSLGSFYALAALGIGLLFGVLKLINFAHGDFITVGAYALIIPSAATQATLFIGDFHPLILIPCIAICILQIARKPLYGLRFSGAMLYVQSGETDLSLPVAPWEAALGGKVKIAARVPESGVPVLCSGRGRADL